MSVINWHKTQLDDECARVVVPSRGNCRSQAGGGGPLIAFDQLAEIPQTQLLCSNQDAVCVRCVCGWVGMGASVLRAEVIDGFSLGNWDLGAS
jgi:hypothetical protein